MQVEEAEKLMGYVNALLDSEWPADDLLSERAFITAENDGIYIDLRIRNRTCERCRAGTPAARSWKALLGFREGTFKPSPAACAECLAVSDAGLSRKQDRMLQLMRLLQRDFMVEKVLPDNPYSALLVKGWRA